MNKHVQKAIHMMSAAKPASGFGTAPQDAKTGNRINALVPTPTRTK